MNIIEVITTPMMMAIRITSPLVNLSGPGAVADGDTSVAVVVLLTSPVMEEVCGMVVEGYSQLPEVEYVSLQVCILNLVILR